MIDGMATPLFLDLEPRAESELDVAMTYLSQSIGTDYAERFTAEAGRVLKEACHDIAEEIVSHGKPSSPMHEAASVRFSRPIYRLDVAVTKARARRSSAGLWYVFYALEDRANIGRPDTLAVVAVRHSAARPFGVEEDADD